MGRARNTCCPHTCLCLVPHNLPSYLRGHACVCCPPALSCVAMHPTSSVPNNLLPPVVRLQLCTGPHTQRALVQRFAVAILKFLMSFKQGLHTLISC